MILTIDISGKKAVENTVGKGGILVLGRVNDIVRKAWSAVFQTMLLNIFFLSAVRLNPLVHNPEF